MNNYHGITIHKSQIESDKWKHTLFKKLPDRDLYKIGTSLEISGLAGRVLGSTYDETDYFIYLYELYKAENVHILSEGLDKTIASEKFQAVQRVWMINQKEKGLSTNRFVAFLDGERLIPKHPNPAMNRHLRKSLITVLDTFKQSHSQSLDHPDFRRVIVDIIKWSSNHLDPWLQATNIEEEMPHVIWYGDATKSQLYFLYYLILVGCDVIILHPGGNDQFAEIDPNNDISLVEKYPDTTDIQPFPTVKPERQSTVAYRSSKEIDNVLHHEGSHLYKPWQFRNHFPHSITLKTTYDELFLIAKERAFIRPNFKATKDIVEIPNIFAKIMGVSKNTKEYWDRLRLLTEFKESETIRNFPFSEEINSNYQFHFQDSLNRNGEIEPEKLMNINLWQYNHLPNGTQKAIAHSISNLCKIPKLLPKNKETVEDVRLYLFAQATNIETRFLNLMQTFDFSQVVPKLILYNTENNGTLSRSDAATLLLLNEFGFDIVIYNPPGHNCIENYIDEKLFDTHFLDEMSFGQEFKEPTFIRKFIKSIKFN
ncbi:YceG family protein [Radiobacillus sp. PE A8.2]|uniref:YceG family protein n=1 Tax=Radiobacillus sp. PE A8.2 TaxID=3380349 RepID=UPI00388E9246